MNDLPLSPELSATTSEQALISLRRILKAVDAHARALARVSSLTPSQLVVLKELAASNGAQPSELARAAGLKQATMSVLVDRLQEKGLVLRTQGISDRRTVIVQITPQGREVLAGAPDLLQVKFGKQFERLPQWEQAYINATLLRIVDLLGAEEIDASPVLDMGSLNELP